MPIVSSGIGTFEVSYLTVGGRRNSVAKRTTDDQIGIDIRVLKREGVLSEGKRNLNWLKEDGTAAGVISLETQRSRVILRYNAEELGGKSAQIEEPISLDQTKGGTGWNRSWFLCPGCGRRSAILYLGGKYFKCRPCVGLVYASQKVTPSQRALSRIRGFA
jgi:hypothetical protein